MAHCNVEQKGLERSNANANANPLSLLENANANAKYLRGSIKCKFNTGLGEKLSRALK